MIILNTTFYVHTPLEPEFLDWLRGEYLPASPLSHHGVAKILTEVAEGAVAYAVSMKAPDAAEAIRWDEGGSAALRQALMRRHGERILCFSTLMEEIDIK